MKMVSLDYGKKRIGIAVSDPLGIIAMPKKMVEAKETLEKTVQYLLSEIETFLKEAKIVIIGYPLLLSGKKGSMAEDVEKFKKILENMVDIPIILWDERLTSSQADRILKEKQLKRKDRVKKIDSAAAAIILQSYIDAKSF